MCLFKSRWHLLLSLCLPRLEGEPLGKLLKRQLHLQSNQHLKESKEVDSSYRRKILEEEGDEDNYPLIRKTKEIKKLVQDLMKESVVEGAKMITSSLKENALKNSFEANVLMEQALQVEATAEAILKDVEGEG